MQTVHDLHRAYLRCLKRQAKRAGGKRAIHYKGICEHAKALGVHRNHLYMVLSGRRESTSLMSRYNQLIEKAK